MTALFSPTPEAGSAASPIASNLPPGAPTEDEIKLAEWLLEQWDGGSGVAKSQLEIQVWSDPASHGRRFDRFVRRVLGVETTVKSRQTNVIESLQRQLLQAGHVPSFMELTDWQEQLHHARQSAMGGVRAWNDPASTFRAGTFSTHLVMAWNSLAIALLMRDGMEWRRVDNEGQPVHGNAGEEHAKDTMELVSLALPGDRYYGVRENIRDWVALRNAAAHRSLPALDTTVIPLAQACLLNFETVLADGFGSDWVLGNQLSVPLQLSGFRDPGVLGSLKQLQKSLPLDVQAVLVRAGEADARLLSDPTYSLRVAFIPAVQQSGRNPDAVAYFVKPGEVPEEVASALDQFVVLPKAFRPKRPNLGAKQVVSLVGERIPFRFNTRTHTTVARKLRVKPLADADPAATDLEYCEYVPAAKLHLYNDAWVERLVMLLQTEDGFMRNVGEPALPK